MQKFNADCLHFKGDVPCLPHKENGYHCDNCPKPQNPKTPKPLKFIVWIQIKKMKRKPTISIDTTKKLGHFLNMVGQCEENLERCRQKLCKLTAFEPYASF